MKLYRLTTTLPGADGSSHFYYDTKEKAEAELNGYDNGEVELVEIVADYEVNYSDGCTMNDLTFGDFNADETIL